LNFWASQVFGIDCTGPFGDGILFKGGEWVPGGEYVQRLRVKNVSPKLKKLKYRLPTTKYFSLAYPEVITLSPGTMQVRRLKTSLDGGFKLHSSGRKLERPPFSKDLSCFLPQRFC